PLLLDPALQFLPWLEHSRRELLEGRLPTWNPHAGLGTPHLANDQAAVFSPFSLLYYLFGAHGLLLGAVLRALLLTVGLYLFLRDEGLGPRAALAGGLGLSCAAPAVAWQLHPHTAAFAWIGLALSFAGRCVRAPRLLAPAGLGLALCTAACLCAGHLQTAFLVALAVGAWTLCAAAREARRRGPSAALAGALRAAACTGLGLALASVHVLPFLAHLPSTLAWREHTGAGIHAEVPWSHLALALFPDLYGNPRDGVQLPALGAPGWLELAGPYVGASLLALGAAGALSGGLRRRPWLAAWALGSGALAALVVYGPLGALWAATPPFARIRGHRLTFLLAPALATAGAVGFDALLLRGGRRRACAAVAVSLSLLALALLLDGAPWRSGPLGRPGRGLAWAVFVPTLAALVALAAAARPQGLSARRAAALCGAALASELTLFATDFAPGADPKALWPEAPALARLAGARVLSVGQVLPPNVATAYGIDAVRCYDALGNPRLAARRARLARFRGALDVVLDTFSDAEADALSIEHVLTDDERLARNLRAGLSGWWISESQPRAARTLRVPRGGVGQTFRAPARPLAAFALPAVRCERPTTFRLVLHRGDGSEPLREASVRHEAGEGDLVFRFPPLAAAGLLHAEVVAFPPGAAVLASARSADPYPAGTRLHDGRVARGDLCFLLAGEVSRPYEEWAFEGGVHFLRNPDALPRLRARGGALQVLGAEGTRRRLRVEGAREVVWAEAWAPGWVAAVDGGPERPLDAFDGLRALRLPPGARAVTLRYRAPGLALGGGLSLAALFLAGLWGALLLRPPAPRVLGHVEA
ncbi:MAG: hypothetical protein D6731_05265, partial [Planctomycetota bacterium]